ncbi:MAG: hypothetical protein ACJAS1_001908 [Oleiphilaceae bacterium]
MKQVVSMNIKQLISRGWKHLKSEDSKLHGMRYIKLVSCQAFVIDVGIMHPNKNRSIIFSFNCSNDELYIPEIILEGFSLSKFSRDDESKYNFSIKLVEHELEENEIFDTICVDLSNSLQKSTAAKGEDKFKDLIERLYTWVDYLKNKKTTKLSFREQLGLFAELYVLEKLKKDVTSEQKLVSSWTGPDRAPKDFVNDEFAIEVKCKLDEESSVKISNLEQLDSLDYGRVTLCILSLVEDSSSNLSLNSLVQRVSMSFQDSSALSVFLKKLDQVGYFVQDMDSYQNTYSVASFNLYLVGPEFPRLTPHTVVSGVQSVKYSISMDSIVKFRIADNDLKEGWK